MTINMAPFSRSAASSSALSHCGTGNATEDLAAAPAFCFLLSAL